MADIEVKLKLTADGSVLVNTAKASESAVGELGSATVRAGRQASQGFDIAAKGSANLKAEMTEARNTAVELAAAVGGLTAIKGLVGSFIDAADAQGQLDARMRRVTEGAAEQAAVTARLQQIAHDAYEDINRLTEIFVRSVEVTKQLGISTAQTLDITEAMALSMVVSATAADKRQQSIDALSKAMQNGYIATEQLEGILAGAPRFVTALEQSLGKTRAELVGMARDGELTIDMVTRVSSELETLRAEVEDMPTTVEDAMVRWGNAFQAWASSTNEVYGSTAALVAMIDLVSANIDTVMVLAMMSATAVMGVLIHQGVMWLKSLHEQAAAKKLSAQATLEAARADLALQKQQEAAAIMLQRRAAAEVKRAEDALKVARADQEAARAAGLRATSEIALARASMAATQADIAATGAAAAMRQARIGQATGNAALAAANKGLAASEADVQKALAGTKTQLLDLTSLISLAVAAVQGWQFGTYLREEFLVVERAGIALVSGLLMAWEKIKVAGVAAWEGIKAAALGGINNVRAAVADLLGLLATANEATDLFGLKAGITDKLRGMEQSIRPTTSAWDGFRDALGKALVAMGANERAIESTMADMWDYAAARRETTAAEEEFARTGAVTTASLDAASAKLRASLAAQNAQLKEQIATYGKGRAAQLEHARDMAIDEAAVKADAGAREQWIAVIREAYAPLIENARLYDSLTESTKRGKQETEAARKAAESYLEKLREEVATYGLSEDAKRRLAMASLALTDAQRAEAEQLTTIIDGHKRLAAALAPAYAALDDLAGGHADLDEQLAQGRDALAGLDRAQIAYNAAVREQNALTAQALALGPLTAEQQAEHEARLIALRELMNQDYAIAEQQRLADEAKRAAENSARAWQDFTGSLADAVLDGSSGVKRWWKQMIDDMKRQLIQSGLLRLFGSLFNIGGAQASSGFGSMFSAMFGGGRGMIGSAAGGGSGLGIGSLVGSGGNLFSGLATAISGGVSSGLMGLGGTLAGLGMGGLGGGLAWAGGSVAANGLLGGLGGSFMTGIGNLFGAGGGALMGIGQMIPAIAAIAGVAMAIQKISGGKLFGTSYGFDSAGRTLDFSATGASGQDRVTEVRQRSLFRGRRWRDTFSDLPDDVADSIGEFWDAVTASNIAIAGDAARTIGAQIKQEFDKDGKVTSTIVEVIGRQYRESMEDAMTRIAAENTIANIDAMLGNAAASYGPGPGLGGGGGGGGRGPDRGGFDAVMEGIGYAIAKTTQTVGEAFAIAERWRSDANLLAEGAQFLLLAATDIRAGAGLLGEGGTLTAITALIEDLQTGSETLSETYARVAGSAALLDQALSLSGVAIDGTREHIVRLATSITDAAGGLETATALWSSYFQNFYSAAELAQYNQAQLNTAAAAAFAGAGLDLSDYIDASGMQRFREDFEAAMPTMSAEDIAAWLRAADALAAVTASARAIDATLADNAWNLYLDGLSEGDRAVAELTRQYDDMRASLLATGATTEQLTTLELQRAEAMGRLMASQEAAQQARIDDIMQPLLDDLAGMQRTLAEAGLSDFARQQAQIARETQEAVAEAMRAGASAADILRINMTGAERAMAAAALAAADFAAELGEWEFEDYLAGLSDADAQRARLDRQWEQRYQQAIEIFGEGSAEAIRVLGLWESAIARVASAAAAATDAATATASRWVSMGEIFDAITAFADKIDERIGHLKGGDAMAEWLAEISGLPRKAQEAVRKPLSEVVSLIQAEYLDKATDLRDQLMRAMQQQAELPWNAQAERHQLDGRIAVLQAALSSITGSMSVAMDELQSMYLASLQGVRDYLDSMLLDPSITTLTPAEQLEEALSRFNAAVAAGDSSGATSMAQTYLQLLRQYEASGQDYNDGFAMIREALEGMLDADIDGLLDPGVQAQLDALADLEALLREIEANTTPPPPPPIQPPIQLPPWHPWDDEQYFPGYAAGGWVNSPTTLLAGEAGRELILPNPVSEFFMRAGIPVNVGGAGDTRALEARLDAVIARLDRLDKTTAQGAQTVSQTIVTTGATSDRNNDQSRARNAQAQRRGVTA